MSIDAIYDQESAIEAAVAALLTASDIAAATPATEVKFQSTRPRVEVIFRLGQGKRSWHRDANNKRRNASWSGVLSIAVITAVDATGKLAHRSYRAAIRNIMATADVDLSLACFKIQGLYEANSTTTEKTTDGYELSTLNYAVDFGVDHDAWSELTA